MHPTDAIDRSDLGADAPAGYDLRSQAAWDLARRDYLAGDSRTQVCDRYGLKPSTFTDRAAREGWRKCDQPDPPPIPDDDPEADEPVDCAALAGDALVRVRRALRRGRAGEAASWMRLHEKLTARLEAEREADRRRDRVARARGSDGADDPLVAALRPVRERMAFINSLGAAQLRVSRAWRQGHISDLVHDRLNGLHSGAVETYDHLLTVSRTLSDPTSSHNSHTDFSTARDP